MVIRALKDTETDLLRNFLYEAIFIPEGVEAPDQSIVEQPELKLYYEDFGKGSADYCLAAEDNGRVIGCVWSRIMHDYGHVDDDTPSLAISLYKEYRGKGIGTALMEGMLQVLREKGYRQVSLSVQKVNPAVNLYTKTGFVTVMETDEEYIMVCRL